MDLKITIQINKEIMQLINSKYPELFPAAYNSPEARYYRMLVKDTLLAERALAAGGLSETHDP